MNQPIVWNARTVTEALNLLEAVEDRINSGMKAAYPGLNGGARMAPARETPLSLRITFDPSELDLIANERSTFDDQVHDDETTHP
ncbi:hypothetical protein [Streptomyces xanthochromogenes]